MFFFFFFFFAKLTLHIEGVETRGDRGCLRRLAIGCIFLVCKLKRSLRGNGGCLRPPNDTVPNRVMFSTPKCAKIIRLVGLLVRFGGY